MELVPPPPLVDPSQTIREDKIEDGGANVYTVVVEGKSYVVKVSDGGDLKAIRALEGDAFDSETVRSQVDSDASHNREIVRASLAGTVVNVSVEKDQVVIEGETLLIIEAMKMETSVAAPRSGTVIEIKVSDGDAITVGSELVSID